MATKKLDIFTNHWLVRMTWGETEHKELGGVDHSCGSTRTGSMVMAKRAKAFRVKMHFLKRLRQAGAKVARLALYAAGGGADLRWKSSLPRVAAVRQIAL